MIISTLKFEIFDHQGNKIFKKLKEDLKENYLKLSDELALRRLLNINGQTKINELDNLKVILITRPRKRTLELKKLNKLNINSDIQELFKMIEFFQKQKTLSKSVI